MRTIVERRELNSTWVVGLVLVFSVFSTAAIGQSSEFRPAHFGIDNRLNQIKISARDLPRNSDSAAVRCQGFVEVDGGLTDYHCITDEFHLEGDYYKQRKVLDAVIRAIPDQTFEPAMFRGEQVRVLMNFSVFVQCTPEPCRNIAVPNHGYHLQEYGFSYFAPQPILADDNWYSGFDYKLKWIRDWMPKIARMDNWSDWDRIPYTLSVVIGADGTAHNECLYWFKRVLNMGFRDTSRTLERARDSIGGVRYIPGFFENEPVSMRLYENSILHDDPDSGTGPYPRTDCQIVGQPAALQD